MWICVSVFECACVYKCVHMCMSVHMFMCAYSMDRYLNRCVLVLPVEARGQAQVSSLLAPHLMFSIWDRAFTFTWSSLVWPDVSRQAPSFTCFYLAGTGISSMHHHIWICFVWYGFSCGFLGSKSSPQCLHSVGCVISLAPNLEFQLSVGSLASLLISFWFPLISSKTSPSIVFMISTPLYLAMKH